MSTNRRHFLGGVVGGFLIAMYLPIFAIAGAVK